MADILRVVSGNAKKTQIMYQANLSYKVLQKYLSYASESCLIDFHEERRCYVLTVKGGRFLEIYREYSEANRSLEKSLNVMSSKRKVLDQLCSSE
jgi:predicted transcriptional regulator